MSTDTPNAETATAAEEFRKDRIHGVLLSDPPDSATWDTRS